MTRAIVLRRALQVTLLALVAWYIASNWNEYEHALSTAHPAAAAWPTLRPATSVKLCVAVPTNGPR